MDWDIIDFVVGKKDFHAELRSSLCQGACSDS